jgi:hypothetical protein
MNMTRRDLATASALALGASGLLHSAALALPPDPAVAVGQAVEAFRKALLEKDQSQLEKLSAAQLSYGHSDARVQTQAEFIDGVMTRKAVVKSLDFPELKITLAGDAAITRHLYVSESETDGKQNSVRIGVLAVWQLRGGNWLLLARQAYKLA